jgi:hypothetical protein
VANPGEVNQEIGRAYQYAFIGALEATVRGFENKFNVHTEPEKTTFLGRSGKNYSFDFCGVNNHPASRCEVFGECKGYSRGTSLLREYRVFLAKAYVTSTDHPRHKNDCFWFVTNVPFACTEGTGIRQYQFVQNALIDKTDAEAQEIVGKGHVDPMLVRSLVGRLGVFILTDSFLMNSELKYKVVPGDTLWSILKKFHAGLAPYDFGAIVNHIANKNGLRSADHIVSGKRITLSWHGIRRRMEDGSKACF